MTDGVLRVMPRFLALTAAMVMLAACGGTEEAATPPPAPAKQTGDELVVAAWSDSNGSEIFWADNRTLEPVFDDRSYRVPFFYGATERSPDGSMIALGGSETGIVDVVDLEKMRSLGSIELPAGTTVDLLHWPTDDRVLANLWGEQPRVATLQPGARKPVVVRDLDGMILKSEPAGEDLVFLLGPRDGIGQARLALFDGNAVRYVDLPGIRAGWDESGEQEDYRARQLLPALAVEPNGERAVVIAPGGGVVLVDLASLTTTQHELTQQASLFERFRDWVEPGAWAKMIDGPELNAAWGSVIALSGVTYTTEGESTRATPSGLAFIHPDNWIVDHESDVPAWVDMRDEFLLASAWDEETGGQTLEVYTTDGLKLCALERGGQADLSQTAGRLLYVSTQDGREIEIVDLTTCETVGRAAPKRPAYIVATD